MKKGKEYIKYKRKEYTENHRLYHSIYESKADTITQKYLEITDDRKVDTIISELFSNLVAAGYEITTVDLRVLAVKRVENSNDDIIQICTLDN